MNDEQWSIKTRLRRARRRKRLRLLCLLVILGLVSYGSVKGWEYIHSPQFAFGRVELHGTNLLTEKDIIAIGGSTEPLNLFNYSFSRLGDGLKHDVRFKTTEAHYRFPDTVVVTVEEREPALYVANSYHSYLKLDYSGLVLSVTTGIPDAKAPLLVGALCGNGYIGDTITNQCVLSILSFLKQLTPEARERIGEIAIDDRQQAKLRLIGSFPILLGAVSELPEKAPLYMTVFDEIKDKNIQAEYIDLTFAKPYIKLLPKQAK